MDVQCFVRKKVPYIGCNFLKSTKLEVNLILAMDFASVKLFSVTYLGLHLMHLVKKCELNKLANLVPMVSHLTAP